MAKPEKTTVQVEKLREQGGLQSTIRSEALYSFDEARPGYVERPDDLYSNPWMQLSKALAGFDQPLSELHRKLQEKEIEQSLAEGDTRFTNSPMDPTTGNRLAWKEYVEQNPDAAGLNPWVRKGYETARMRSLGLDFKARLQDAYSKNGLMNETDQAKVSQFIDQFERDFRKKHGLDDYDDKVILAENYTKEALEGRAAILNRHIKDFAEENLKRVTQEFTQLTSKQLSSIVDNPNLNFTDPDVREKVIIPQIQEAIQRISQEAASYGVLNSDVPGIIFKALAAEATERGYEDGGDDLLEIARNLDFGQGKLGDIPEYKDFITKAEKQMEAQEEQDRLKREREQEKALTDVMVDAAINGKYYNAEQLRAKGVPAHMVPAILSKINSIQNSREINEGYGQWGVDKRTSFLNLQLKAARGELTDSDLRSAVRVYGKEVDRLLSLHLNSESTHDTLVARTIGGAQNQVFQLVTGKKDGDLNNLSQDQHGDPKIQRGLEAASEVMFTLKNKIEKETGGGKGELSAARAEFLAMEAVEEVVKKDKYGIYAKEKGVPAPHEESQIPQPGGPKTAQPVSPEVTARAQAILADAQAKPLFRDQIGQSVQEWDQAYEEWNSSQDKVNTRLGQAIINLNIPLNQQQIQALIDSQQLYYRNALELSQKTASLGQNSSPLDVFDQMYQTFVVEDRMDFGSFKRVYNRVMNSNKQE